MLNSLDSVTHQVACLQRKFPDSVISPLPYDENDLEKMKVFYDRRYYFGVLTLVDFVLIGDEVFQINFGNDVWFDVDPLGQIIEGFQSIRCYDTVTSTERDISKFGKFRGFEITLR